MIQKTSSKITNDRWITPEEQLELLDPAYYTKEVLKYHPEIGPDIAERIGGFTAQPKANLTYWHTALKLMDALPEKIPALPPNIDAIMESPCPIFGGDKKVRSTHSLYLIPSGSLNELEIKVRSCGERLYPNENPLQFDYFWGTARKEHGASLSNDPYWILMTNDVLPGSRRKRCQAQAQMIEDLSKKTKIDYEVPHLKDAIMAIFLEKIATGESRYEVSNEQSNHLWSYTRVQETTSDWYLVVGGFAPSGLFVRNSYGYGTDYIGVAALRKFS